MEFLFHQKIYKITLNKLNLIVIWNCKTSIFLSESLVGNSQLPLSRIIREPVDVDPGCPMVDHRGCGTRGLSWIIIIPSCPSQTARQDPLESSPELCGHEAVEHRVDGTEVQIKFSVKLFILDEKPVDVDTCFGKHQKP